jgi:hypothetical protein
MNSEYNRRKKSGSWQSAGIRVRPSASGDYLLLAPRSDVQLQNPSRFLRLLGQDFLTSGEALIKFGAHFIEEITFDRIEHLA